MSELSRNFKQEALELVDLMVQVLEAGEGGESPEAHLSTFGQYADRIMGGAKQVQLDGFSGAAQIAGLAALLKNLGYKASRLEPFSSLLTVAVGVLLDATGELNNLIKNSGESTGANSQMAGTLIDRLEWLDRQFSPEIHGGVPDSVRVDGEFADLLSRVKNQKTNS